MPADRPVPPTYVEHVEMTGHIVDSLLLPKVLDAILSRGGKYHIDHFKLGEKQDDTSFARIEVRATPPNNSRPSSPRSIRTARCRRMPPTARPSRPTWTAHSPTASTARPTSARRCGSRANGSTSRTRRWTAASSSMPRAAAARCVAMTAVRKGDRVVVGRRGTRVLPPEAEIRKHELFEFMASPVSSERPKAVSVREIAHAMRKTRAAGEKVLAVLGPAVVHTGGSELVAKMVRDGWINVLFAGNALATHDIEQAFYGTSLGVSLDRGLPDR